MKSTILTLFFAWFFMNSSAIAQVQVATLNPIFDVGILESSPGLSLSAGPMLCGHSCAGYQSRALMTFSMNLIPAGSTITSVNLTVNSNWVDPAGSDTATYTLHALTTGYLEYPWWGGTGAGADWTIAGSGYAGPALWTTPGGDYLPDTLSSQWVPHTLGLHNFPTTSNFVNCVQGWLDVPTTNRGIIMIADTVPCNTDKYFDGWEMPVPAVLEITYILPCSTGPAAVCQDIDVHLDGSGNASIVASDLDGGSIDSCMTGGLAFSASQTSFSCSDISSGGSSGFIITGVYDATLTGGTPKGVELYAGTAIADLSNYGIGSANNGGGSDGEEFTFPAISVPAGSFIYVTTDSAQFNTFFGFDADFIDGSMAINGDDAIELFQGGSVIDVFGDINIDGTGQPWEYQDGWAYRNDLQGSNAGVFTSTNWMYSGINALDNETSNATAATPFPVASFTAGSSGIPVIFTVTDGLGNIDSCTALVSVFDTITPVPDVAALADLEDDCEVTPTAPTATGGCAGSITGSTTTTFPITSSTTITWTYNDGNGNIATQDQVVTINGLDLGVQIMAPSPTLSADATGVTYQWIDCSDNSIIAGETNQTFTATADGDYAVIIDNGSCSDTSTCINVSVGGLNELDLGVTIAPNPSTGIFNVSFENSVAGIVSIVDANGRLIQTQELNDDNLTIDLKSAQSGLYFMNVTTEDGVSRTRLVKQ